HMGGENGAGLDLLRGQAFFEQLRKTFGHECFRGRFDPLALAGILDLSGVVTSSRASGAVPEKQTGQ
ncbi:MAG TPA: hypothetical protein PKH77_19695, partial [Anaerolineae bacterium]|nr:hypothetical protein [Anaerolineae bacterium]